MMWFYFKAELQVGKICLFLYVPYMDLNFLENCHHFFFRFSLVLEYGVTNALQNMEEDGRSFLLGL